MNIKWIECNLPFYTEEEIPHLSNRKSFTGRKLNQPGTLIEVEVNSKLEQYPSIQMDGYVMIDSLLNKAV